LADGGDPSDDVFGFSEAAPAVAKLIPTQNEVDIDKSLAYPLIKKPGQFVEQVSGNGPFKLGAPIVTYNGRYVIDGHHRWSTLYSLNKNAQIVATNITIEGLEPLDVLKAVQMAIGLDTGGVPMQNVEGTNLLKLSKADLSGWIKKNVKGNLYAAIAADPEVKQLLVRPQAEEEGAITEFNQMETAMLRAGLLNYLWSNVESMRQTSQPVPGAGPRDFMPQTDDANWKEPLEKGQIDIKPPHGQRGEETPLKKVAESRIRRVIRRPRRKTLNKK
jgi:hypothetical protein